MKTVLYRNVALAGLMLMSALFCAGCGEKQAYTKMEMDKAQEVIEAGTDALIVDVRTQEEYDKGHIPGAVLVPIDDIEAGKLEALPDKNREMVVYCWTGRRSEKSAAALAEDGYSHVCDIGGFIDWQGEVETAAS